MFKKGYAPYPEAEIRAAQMELCSKENVEKAGIIEIMSNSTSKLEEIHRRVGVIRAYLVGDVPVCEDNSYPHPAHNVDSLARYSSDFLDEISNELEEIYSRLSN